MAICGMAEDKSVLDALSDESKAVAINGLIESIQALTSAAQSASFRLNAVKGERASIDDAPGITGVMARLIKGSQLSDARKSASSVYGDLQDARLRMVNLTGSRITNFRRLEGESGIDALNRLGGLHAQYRYALSEAMKTGALVGQDYIDKREVDATARQFILNPDADRFKSPDKEDDKASNIVKAYFGQKMQKLATLGGKYFSMANPMMQRFRTFIGRDGGFNLMGGLRAMGPMGIAASAGIGIGRQYLNFLDKTFGAINQRQNQALLSGLDVKSVGAFGGALGAFGGDAQGAARLSGGIATTLGGMRFGQGGGRLTEMARQFGVNIMGSGYGGLATTQELLYRIADVMHSVNDSDKEMVAYMAQQIGLSADQVRLFSQGSEAVRQQVDEMKRLTVFLNSPDAVKNAEEYSRLKAEGAVTKDIVEQKLAGNFGKWWEGSLSNIEAWQAKGADYGPIGAVVAGMGGVAEMTASFIPALVGMNDKFHGAADWWSKSGQEKFQKGGFWNEMLGTAEGSIGTILHFFGGSRAGIESLREDGQNLLADTVSGSSSNKVYNIDPTIKVEQTVTVASGSSDDLGRLASATEEGLKNGYKGIQRELVGAEE